MLGMHFGRYGLNIGFNLLNKSVFNYFPFPWTVSAIHVVVGTLYCGVAYLLGFKEASFGRVRQSIWVATTGERLACASLLLP